MLFVGRPVLTASPRHLTFFATPFFTTPRECTMSRKLISALTLFAAAGTASAQYTTGFEGPLFTPGIITGQDLFYIPTAGGIDGTIQTYAGNTQTIPQNPFGGAQYQSSASQGNAATTFARSQRDTTWTLTTWTATFDFCGAYIGAPGAAAQNLGSFSTQPYTAVTPNNGWIMLLSFTDPLNPTTFQAGINAADAAGVATPQPGYFPSPAWQNLPMNRWFRFSLTTNFQTAQIIAAQITDLTTCATTSVDLTNIASPLYCSGGAVALTTPLTGFRLFGGGGVGNVAAYDNINIVEGGLPSPPTCGTPCYANCDGVGGLTANDFVCFVSAFNSGASYANCDNVGGLTANDFVCFLTSYNNGCS
jgi:hypothetical protein